MAFLPNAQAPKKVDQPQSCLSSATPTGFEKDTGGEGSVSTPAWKHEILSQLPFEEALSTKTTAIYALTCNICKQKRNDIKEYVRVGAGGCPK